MKRRRLSKSRLKDKLQCPKKLWLATYKKDEATTSAATESRFARGNEVGAVARDQVPGGIFVNAPGDLTRALAETAVALAIRPRRAIFEATFTHGDCLVQVDTLIPSARGSGYRLCEVKSTSSAKPEHEADCAIQTWVVRGAGIKVDQTELVHLNRDYVYDGSGRYDGLFTFQPMDAVIAPLVDQVPNWIADSQRILAGPEPGIRIGPQCSKPHECPFMAYCAKQEPAPPEYPVTLLPGNDGKSLARKLAATGYADLRDVPASEIPAGKFQRIWHATRIGKPFIGKGAAKQIQALPFPRHYFDFETIDFAVPRWAGTQPWQQVPFQWSCHVEHADGRLEHREFLDISGSDPREECARQIVDLMSGADGCVLVYFQPFEESRLRELARDLPEFADGLRRVIGKLRDLLPIVQAHYYHPDQQGSYSLKAVLPTVVPELDYADLDEVRDGGGAQRAYLELIDASTDGTRRSSLSLKLRAYCERDTLAMVELVRRLSAPGNDCVSDDSHMVIEK